MDDETGRTLSLPLSFLRKEHGFMELCKNPRLAATVALGPIEAFDFDVAILFSDLLFPWRPLGLDSGMIPLPN